MDVSRVPVMRQRLALDLEGVTLKQAITAISRQSGLMIWYSDDVLRRDTPVHLRASAITVAAALTDVLMDAGVDVVFSRDGTASLVKRTATAAPAQTGTITGRVTDARTQQGVAGVRVFLEGTRWNTTTGDAGNYRLATVTPGAYTLVMRRVGYKQSEQAVTVDADRETEVNVTLQPVPSALDQVVVTVTGEQRLRELGHVVGRINADSLVKEAPVSNLSELLNGRVPGLQVNTYQGTVGGNVALQIRGPNTIQLSTEPIVIVDGIRYTSSAAVQIALGSGTVNDVEPTSPLNDLNPNTIESIQVVKGPSAATLYGTDAANGVIVITTKRGRSGATRWNAYAKGARTTIPKIDYPNAYWGWRSVGGVPSLTAFCGLHDAGVGACVQDSVTVLPNPLNDPQLTIFEPKPRWEYGVNASGGSQDLRYFVAGDVEEATGPLRMPPAMADSIAAVRGLPAEQREPNAFTKVNLRSNMTAGLGKTAELQINAGYNHRTTRTIAANFINPYATAFSDPRPGQPYGESGPDQLFSRTTTEKVSRFFGSVTSRWSPSSWLVTRGTAGVDLASVTRASLARRGEVPQAVFGLFEAGEIADDRGRQLAITGELAATASFSSGRLSSRTSIGAQYVRAVEDVLGSTGMDLPPGGSTIGMAAIVQSRQSYREQATLGSYLEQVVGLNQRLFVTGALRMDGASTFGRDYDAAVYPKASVSWLLSEEPMLPRVPLLEDLRLRYAFGASGQQPQPGWNRPGYAARPAVHGGGLTNVYALNSLGNPDIRPERVREHEFGFDLTALQNRLDLGVTWYRRTTVDQIVGLDLPPGLGRLQTNLGRTAGRGFEAQLSVRPVDRRAVRWQIALQHSVQRTTLEDLGGGVELRLATGGWVEGYPLGARFQRPLLGYEDADGDGIITAWEVRIGDTAVFAGESAPPRAQTLGNTLSFFDRRLRLSALLERRAGFTQLNALRAEQCGSGLCRERVDPSTPLAEQAIGVARLASASYRYIEPGDFTRLREVAIAADLPAAAVRALRLPSATVSVQGRNLALWTSYSGADPESASPRGFTRQELGFPQGRTWALRLDIGF